MVLHLNEEEVALTFVAVQAYARRIPPNSQEGKEYRRRVRKLQGKIKWRLNMRKESEEQKDDLYRLRAAANYLDPAAEELSRVVNWEPETSTIRQILKRLQEQIDIHTSVERDRNV